MNTNATHALTDSNINFGGEASGTAGNAGTARPKGTISSDDTPATMVYSDASGFYGGAAMKGGSLAPDTDGNVAYYGESLETKEILFEKKGKPTEAGEQLWRKSSPRPQNDDVGRYGHPCPPGQTSSPATPPPPSASETPNRASALALGRFPVSQ